MDNAFTLKFTLKQHTPLVHFQHDQAGATLRATELKAKLDRFLAVKITGNEEPSLKTLSEHPVYGDFLIGGKNAKSPAFDYKVKIYDLDSAPDSGQTALITTDDIGYWKQSNAGIKVIISVFHPELKSLIAEHYHAFFACTNFGKRQSKGWGSFFPTTKENEFEQLLLSFGKPVYKMSTNLQVGDRRDEFYAQVLRTWRLLKSGINLPNTNPSRKVYKKSLAFKYMAGNGFRWDKRLLKKDINSLIEQRRLRHDLKAESYPPIDSQTTGNQCRDDEENYNDWVDNPDFSGQYRFVRALLGMPELYEFQASGSYIHQVTFSKENIERFKAPVTFKIFGNHLYAIAEKIPTGMYGTMISAVVKSKPRSGGGTIVGPFDMPSDYQIPSAEEFNLTNFLDQYFPCVGLNRIK